MAPTLTNVQRVPALLAVLCLMCAATTFANRCESIHWDDDAGTDQTDPDRPCSVSYTVEKSAEKLLKAQNNRMKESRAESELATGPPGNGADHKATTGATATTSLMTNHGGPIAKKMAIQAVFWGTKSFTAEKMAGLDRFFNAYSNSGYANTCQEYPGADKTTYPMSDTVYMGSVINATSTLSVKSGSNVTPIGSKVCQLLKAAIFKSAPTAEYTPHYAVFTDVKRGANINFCAWHASGYCLGNSFYTTKVSGGTYMTFSFYFNVDTDSGCAPASIAVNGRSVGLSGLANLAAHEVSEARTDPNIYDAGQQGWYDAAGAENADKCAWQFDEPVILADKSEWKLQGEWSNSAFTAGTGKGPDKGCIYSAPLAAGNTGRKLLQKPTMV